MYKHGFMLEHLCRQGKVLDKQTVLDQVTKCGSALKFAKDFCDDKDVVLAAVKQCGRLLEHASIGLRSDIEVVLAAVALDGAALRFAAPLQHNKDVVLAAVRQHGEALKFAGVLRSDKEVVLSAVAQSASALIYVDSELQSDKDVLETAIKCSAVAVFSAYDIYKHNLVAPKTSIALFSTDMLMFAASCCPRLCGGSDERLRTQQVVAACITASVDAIACVRANDMCSSLQVELAHHFIDCCKKAGLDRDACIAKAGTCPSRSLSIRICCAAYSLY
jgi:hypothetical protein